MPLITSTYHPPVPFRHGHLQTVYPTLFRKVERVRYVRERIETPDDDFLDLDWVTAGRHRVAILSHGLEGRAERAYMQGMARILFRHGWDVLAWNYRGCSGEPNRQLRSYHSGATDDLDLVVRHALDGRGYASAALVGFSLGGNLTLKYIGERGDDLDPRIQAAVTFSVPCDLGAGADRIDEWPNWVYRERFLRTLREKVHEKKKRFPEAVDTTGLARIKTIRAFDDHYTAPVHGFEDANDYYARCSSLWFIPGICIPTLLVSAVDDPFLPPACYPVDVARTHPFFHFELTRHGGHVGFVAEGRDGAYWSEQRAVRFLDDMLAG